MSRKVPLLSAFRLTGWPSSLYPKMTKNRAIYKVSFLASVVAIYSALIEEKTTVGCYFDWWGINSRERRKTYPLVNLCPFKNQA